MIAAFVYALTPCPAKSGSGRAKTTSNARSGALDPHPKPN
jgi:hypothetical protein